MCVYLRHLLFALNNRSVHISKNVEMDISDNNSVMFLALTIPT